MPGFPAVPGDLAEEITGKTDGLYAVYHPLETLQDVVLFDLPDFTTEASAREGDITLALLPWFDRILIVVDHERWFDRQSISKLRAASSRYGQERLVLFNRTCEGELQDTDRQTLQAQADRLGAEGMVILEFRRGRGFCRFAPGTLDDALAFTQKPRPDRTGALRRQLTDAANDVLNQNEERAARLTTLEKNAHAAADRALPDEHGCMTSLMVADERKHLEVISRVLRVHDARQWMSNLSQRIGSALRRVPGVGLALPSAGKAPSAGDPNEADRTAVALAYAEGVARRQVLDIRRAVDNSDFWDEIRRWADLEPESFEFAWTESLRSDIERLARGMDDAISRWNERVDRECEGLGSNVKGAVGVSVLALAVVLIAVPGPVAALTLTSAGGAIGAALTKIAAAGGAGALFGKPLGRLSAALTEKLMGSPELDAVRDAAAAFCDRLAAFGRDRADAALREAQALVMRKNDPLAQALEAVRQVSESRS